MSDWVVAIGSCLAFTALWALMVGVGAFIFMVVWNIFVPAVLGGPVIDYITAFAGWVLLGIIGSAFRSIVTSK